MRKIVIAGKTVGRTIIETIGFEHRWPPETPTCTCFGPPLPGHWDGCPARPADSDIIKARKEQDAVDGRQGHIFL